MYYRAPFTDSYPFNHLDLAVGGDSVSKTATGLARAEALVGMGSAAALVLLGLAALA